VIQNITTVNNEVIISTQLDISNQGTGPALKVSQFGVGDDQDVALFNAGDEGDAFKIDSSGNSHFYKEVNIVKLKVEGGNTELGGDLSVSGTTTTGTLNTSTIDSSGRVDIGSANGQSKGLVLTGNSPTITLKDTNGRTGMIHMNDNNMFFLSGETNSEVWSQVNGEWPLILHTDTNLAQFGGSIDAVGNITCGGYMKATNKPRMRIIRDNFTLGSGTTSLLNDGTVSLKSNCTVSSGIFIATISGIYACSCKLRLPDNNGQTPEIQWYRRASNGTQTSYEQFEMWIPAGVSGRRAGMTHTLIDLSVGQGVLPRNDGEPMSGCHATFDVFMIQ